MHNLLFFKPFLKVFERVRENFFPKSFPDKSQIEDLFKLSGKVSPKVFEGVETFFQKVSTKGGFFQKAGDKQGLTIPLKNATILYIIG